MIKLKDYLKKNPIKKLLKKIDSYWFNLNDTTNNSEKEKNAKREILELFAPVCFIFSSFILIQIIVIGEKIENKQGSGFIFFGWIITFILLAFVTLRIRKNRKCQD